MSQPDDWTRRVVPAQLDFLAIYSPDLATSEHTERDQIVFFYSRQSRERKRNKKDGSKSNAQTRGADDDENEQMRQVGLAQGLVSFARDFSNGEPVDSVDTEKHRIVIKELEKSWWILASIQLTRLPLAKTSSNSNGVEYSSREVSPPALLLQQIQAAHRIFLLHQSPSLSDLYVRLPRPRFCALLDKYWKRFSKHWDVLLHGNPAVDVYSGVKLAAGGELGIGVGEEEWGSGERAVLEDIVENTAGLVDAFVFRFGRPESSHSKPATHLSPVSVSHLSESSAWLGTLDQPGAADGLLFSGTGAVQRSSIRDLSDWVRSIYVYGEDAYGVRENPSSDRRKRRRLLPFNVQAASVDPTPNMSEAEPEELQESIGYAKGNSSLEEDGKLVGGDRNDVHPPSPVPGNIPPPIVPPAQKPPKKTPGVNHEDVSSDAPKDASGSDTNVWVKYLTLGYGSAWGNTGNQRSQLKEPKDKAHEKLMTQDNKSANGPRPSVKSSQPEPDGALNQKMSVPLPSESRSQTGHFLVGLKGDLTETPSKESDSTNNADSGDESSPDSETNDRLVLRTVQIKVSGNEDIKDKDENDSNVRRLRIVVYAHRPFLFLFLFDPTSASLTLPSFFRSLHHNLAPLHKPLLQSTSPSNIAKRLQATLNHHGGRMTSLSPIYDLIYDPQTLSVRSSIPNIPMPGTLAAEGFSPPTSPPGTLDGHHSSAMAPQNLWTRVEALTVHAQILNAYAETRRDPTERERTVKTGKGWWVAWMRVPAAVGARKDVGGANRRPVTADADENVAATGSKDGTDSGPPGSARVLQSDKALSRPLESNKEAVLVRRANDSASRRSGAISMGGLGMSMGLGRIMGQQEGQSPSSGTGAGRLGDEIGVDTRGYVERLLSLSR